MKTTASFIVKLFFSFSRALNLFIAACLLTGFNSSLFAQEQVDLNTAEPILVYERSHQMLADQDNFKIQLFSDGYALVHYPSYMKKSGNYSVQLSTPDFQRLVEMLDTPDVNNYDDQSIALKKKSADKTNGLFTYISDSTDSSFEVSRSDRHGKNKRKQRIRSRNLQHDAKKHRNIGAISQLSEVESLLIKIIDRSDLQELPGD